MALGKFNNEIFNSFNLPLVKYLIFGCTPAIFKNMYAEHEKKYLAHIIKGFPEVWYDIACICMTHVMMHENLWTFHIFRFI